MDYWKMNKELQTFVAKKRRSKKNVCWCFKFVLYNQSDQTFLLVLEYLLNIISSNVYLLYHNMLFKIPNTMSNRSWVNIDNTSMCRKENIGGFPRYFDYNFSCIFDGWLWLNRWNSAFRWHWSMPQRGNSQNGQCKVCRYKLQNYI